MIPLVQPVSVRGRAGRRSAFTLIEIALCIAIVSIAMVAIIGVLPTGLNVQRQNREEAMLTQDAELLLNAIRSGQVGLQDLVNFADRVTLVRDYRDGSPSRTNYFHGPLVVTPPADSQPFGDAFQLLGLISRPRYTREVSSNNPNSPVVVTNTIHLEMRTLSGSMANQPIIRSSGYRTPGSDPRIDFAFRYLVTIETVARQGVRVPGDLERMPDTTDDGVSEIRLTLEWPLVRNGPNPAQYRLGFNRREFRTEVLSIPVVQQGNVPQSTDYYGPIVYPFRAPPQRPTPSEIYYFRMKPGTL